MTCFIQISPKADCNKANVSNPQILQTVCCKLYYFISIKDSSFAIILMGTRELVALLSLPSWCLMIVARLFLAVPWVCLPFVIVVFPDHTYLLYLQYAKAYWVPQMSFEQS